MEIVVKRKRAAAYCRVSTGMECQEGSYEIQRKATSRSCSPITPMKNS